MRSMQLIAFCATLLVCGMGQLQCADADSRVVLHARHSYPTDWTLGGRAKHDERVHFRIALKQRNVEALRSRFEAVADPTHEQYRKFMTTTEIQELVSPSQSSVRAVQSWFASHQITGVIQQGDSVVISCTVAQAEALLGCQLFSFVHKQRNSEVFKIMGEHSVPQAIASKIDFVCGLTEFGQRRDKKLAGKPLKDAAPDMHPLTVPSTIRSLYQLPEGKVKNGSSTQAIVEFPFRSAATGVKFADLSAFEEQMGLPPANITSIVGPFIQTSGDPESTLDLQYILAVAQAKTEFTVIDGFAYEYAAALFQRKDAALVQSLSYGGPENQMCNIPSKFPTNCTLLGIDLDTYFSRVNTEFMKIGLRGISILACSQDEGAPGAPNIMCGLDKSDYPLFPVFPATSPYVTAVGATALDDAVAFDGGDGSPFCKNHSCAKSGTEVPAMAGSSSSFSSGGGFSNYSSNKAPGYQLDAIATWMKSGALMPTGKSFFKPQNRGYPDLSAIGDRYIVWSGGEERVIGGTSASTPVVAGMIALLNDVMLSAGKPPMGFLNPLLYSMAKAAPETFHDVTVGNNTCTAEAHPSDGSKPYGICCKYGYGAAPGWDPVVGLGTPNFKAWVAYARKVSEAL